MREIGNGRVGLLRHTAHSSCAYPSARPVGALENGQAARNGGAASDGGISVAGTGAPQAATDNASYRPITRQAVRRYWMGSLVGGGDRSISS